MLHRLVCSSVVVYRGEEKNIANTYIRAFGVSYPRAVRNIFFSICARYRWTYSHHGRVGDIIKMIEDSIYGFNARAITVVFRPKSFWFFFFSCVLRGNLVGRRKMLKLVMKKRRKKMTKRSAHIITASPRRVYAAAIILCFLFFS